MNMIDTWDGSMMKELYPAGWDMAKIDACCSHPAEAIQERQPFWHEQFSPVSCPDLPSFDIMLGHEVAMEIRGAKERGEKLALILPAATPMGMYRWMVYFLQQWNIDARHVYGFNMDEWSDASGQTLSPSNPGSFQYAMEHAFYGPLGDKTVPVEQRNYATRDNLPRYAEKIAALKAEGARLVVIFGIGRVFHIAFWEPQFAAEFNSVEDWKKPTHRVGARLHPLTIEQNALTCFMSRSTLVPNYANTIGPGLFLQADRIIGGCDGSFGQGMQWQGMSLWVTLRHSPDIWVPSSFMPTLPGKLFYLADLAGPLRAI